MSPIYLQTEEFLAVQISRHQWKVSGRFPVMVPSLLGQPASLCYKIILVVKFLLFSQQQTSNHLLAWLLSTKPQITGKISKVADYEFHQLLWQVLKSLLLYIDCQWTSLGHFSLACFEVLPLQHIISACCLYFGSFSFGDKFIENTVRLFNFNSEGEN